MKGRGYYSNLSEPHFKNSEEDELIQLADIAAYIIRRHHEKELGIKSPDNITTWYKSYVKPWPVSRPSTILGRLIAQTIVLRLEFSIRYAFRGKSKELIKDIHLMVEKTFENLPQQAKKLQDYYEKEVFPKLPTAIQKPQDVMALGALLDVSNNPEKLLKIIDLTPES